MFTNKVLMFTNKVLNSMVSTDMFTTISETHCRVTRTSNRQDLYLPGGKHK